MVKLMIIIAVIYAIVKTLNSWETGFIGNAFMFIKSLLLFPLMLIIDIKNYLTTDLKVKEVDECCKPERKR